MVLFSSCKIKFQKELYNEAQKFNQILEKLPEEIQKNLGKNISDTEKMLIEVIDKGKSAGKDLVKDSRKEFEKGFKSAVQDAGDELSNLIEEANEVRREQMEQTDLMLKERFEQVNKAAGARMEQANRAARARMEQANKAARAGIEQVDGIAKNRIDQLDEIAGKRITEVDKMRRESLNKTDSIIQNAIFGVDSTMQNAINAIDISVEEKMLLANELARQNIDAFMAHLDRFVETKAKLVDKILEQRINQIFDRLNETIILTTNEMEEALGRTIHRTYYMGNVVAKNLIDAAQKSTIILFVVIIKGIIALIAFVFLLIVILGIIRERIALDRITFIGTIFMIVLSVTALFTDVPEKMIGEKYIKSEDIFTTTEKNFKKVVEIFNSPTQQDTWKTIHTCAEAIQGLEMCKVLSTPDNEALQSYYNERIEDVNWLLTKSLPEQYLKQK